MQKINLPETLDAKLREFRRKLRLVETSSSILLLFSIGSVSFLSVFVSDRLCDTSSIFRSLMLACAIIPILFFIFHLIFRILIRHRDFKELSILVQKYHRKLGDSLLGVVELSEDHKLSENVSKELCDAAIANIAKQSESLNFCDAINMRHLKRFAIAAAALLLLQAMFLITMREAFSSSLTRWMNPISPLERFTFVKMNKFPSEMTVPHGEEFEINCSLDAASKIKPEGISWKCGKEPTKTIPFTGGAATIKVPGQTKQVTIKVKAWDFMKKIEIIPLYRPILNSIDTTVKYPGYLKKADAENRLNGNTVSILEGGGYSLKGKVNRDLKSAELTANGTSEKLQVKASSFTTGSLDSKTSGKYSISWLDIYNLAPLHPFEYTVSLEKDQAPFTECPKLPLYSAVLKDEVITINVKAEDDYGILKLAFKYSAADSKNEKNIYKNELISLGDGGSDKTSIESEFRFSPLMLGIKEQSIVTVNSLATDYFPGREYSASVSYRIYVLSLEEHAKLIHDELENMMSKLEDIVWREEENLEKNKEISRMPVDEIGKEKTADKISDQKEAEQMNSTDLQKLAEQTMKLLNEALRNKEFPDSTLEQWSKMMEVSTDVSQKDMKQVVESLKNALDEKGRSEKMKDAAAEQEKLLEKLKELMKKMDKSLNDMSLKNFVSRLRKEAEKENAISDSLKDIMKNSAGMDLNSLPEKLRSEVENQNRVQNDVRKNIKDIQNDLTSFFSRTRIKKYMDVVEKMEYEKIHRRLEDLSEKIMKNQSAQGIKESKDAASKFNEWAKYLSEADDAKKGADGDGEMIPVDPELVLGLMRLIQEEQDLRENTRFLEENKDKVEDYSDKSTGLSEKQMEMKRTLSGLNMKYDICPAFKQLMDKTEKAMTDAGALLFKPQTDQETIGAETEVIENLSSCFKEASEEMKGAQGMDMLSMLMQMMMSKGRGFRGSIHSDAANTKINGPDFKASSSEKTGERVTSPLENLPEEFRDAIESYYKNLNSFEKGK